MKQILALFIVAILLNSCKSKSDMALPIIDESGIALRNWHVMGPFPSNGQENYLDVDNLKYWGLNERKMRGDDFAKIKIDTTNKDFLPNFVNLYHQSPDDAIDLNQIFGYLQMEQSISGNAYLGLTLQCDKKQTLYLNFSSDDNAKVWLNGKEILRLEKSEAIIAYEKYVPVKLKKGNNFFLVKINNGMYDWQMYAKLEPKTEEGLKRNHILLSRLLNHKFLDKTILDTIEVVKTSERLPEKNYEITIEDLSNQKMETLKIKNPKTWEKNLEHLKNGLYLAKMKLNNDTLTQYLYKGNLIEDTRKLIGEFDLDNVADKNYVNSVKANAHRFNHLLKPGNTGSNAVEKLDWQRKLVYLYKDLKAMKNRQGMNDPLKGIPGIHIRSYISKIDNQPQYFIVHVPEKYSEHDTLPLVAFMPAKLPNHQLYLESMRVADLKLVENLQDMADKYNMIVMQPFFREVGKPNLNLIGETDYFEVYETIKYLYNIDTTRIFLTGTCAGGVKLLEMAVRYPDMFNAMGVVSPEFHQKYSENPWFVNNKPMNFMKNIGHIPMLIIHSSKDKHTGVFNSDVFVDFATEFGMKNITYKRLDNVIDLYYWYSFSDDIFEFFVNQGNKTMPEKFTYGTNLLKYNQAYWIKDIQFDPVKNAEITAEIRNNDLYIQVSDNVFSYNISMKDLKIDRNRPVKITENNRTVYEGKVNGNNYVRKVSELKRDLHKTAYVEGPFTQIFADRFLVVVGTIGNSKEDVFLKAMADSMNAYWLFKYQNECMVKNDIDITDEDIETCNLILLGNFGSNAIMQKIKNQLPLKINEGGIVIKNKSIKGSNLSFYMAYPNPLNSSKYVGIIGYNNKNFINIGKPDMTAGEYAGMIAYLKNEQYYDLSTYGWFDYKVWTPDFKILENRNFDYSWNN